MVRPRSATGFVRVGLKQAMTCGVPDVTMTSTLSSRFFAWHALNDPNCSHTPSHSLSHMTYGSPEQTLIIPPARDGRRWRFSEADKRHIVEEAVQPHEPGRYGIKRVRRRCPLGTKSSSSAASLTFVICSIQS